MIDILFYALAAGLLLVIPAGPLGSIILWQRMAYYGDTLAHSALLGVALGLLFDSHVELTVIGVCVLLALLLGPLHRISGNSLDSLLGIAAHTSLALGLVAVSMQSGAVDLNAYLFGDILAVQKSDLLLLAGVSALCCGLMLWRWNALVAIATHRDLAQVEGHPVARLEILQMVLMALLVAVGMKIVGVLLISALLIIPAATAGRLSRTPEQVAFGAIGCGCLAVGGGLFSAWQLDTPAGPSIVLFAASLFFLLLPLGRRTKA